jgi:hypothetical protein
MKTNNKVIIYIWLWVKKNMMGITEEINRKFIETNYRIDSFSPDVGKDLDFVLKLKSLFIIDCWIKKCCSYEM